MGIGSSLMNGDMLKLSMLIMVLSLLLMMLMGKVRKVLSKNKKAALIYALVILASFALTGLLSSKKVLNDVASNMFIGFEIVFLLLGVLNVYVLRKHFLVLSSEGDHWSEYLFTLGFTGIGLIAFTNVVNYFNGSFTLYFSAGALLFILPILFLRMYELADKIPVPVYKTWAYPLGKKVKDPTSRELDNPLVISFEFPKTDSDGEVTKFRVKAPEEMEFGKLFYFFINDYNERHVDSKIEFLNPEDMSPHNWIFYFKPSKWKALRHINHVKTIMGNGIKEDQVIVCERIMPSNEEVA